jgi:hypothetical protein
VRGPILALAVALGALEVVLLVALWLLVDGIFLHLAARLFGAGGRFARACWSLVIGALFGAPVVFIPDAYPALQVGALLLAAALGVRLNYDTGLVRSALIAASSHLLAAAAVAGLRFAFLALVAGIGP